jgi:hypothetical protein
MDTRAAGGGVFQFKKPIVAFGAKSRTLLQEVMKAKEINRGVLYGKIGFGATLQPEKMTFQKGRLPERVVKIGNDAENSRGIGIAARNGHR